MEVDTQSDTNNLTLEKLAFIDDNTIKGHAIININGNYKINKQDEGVTLTYLVNIFNRVIKKTKENHKNTIIVNMKMRKRNMTLNNQTTNRLRAYISNRLNP